ncbi:uncharacterized protein V6R79_017116 [Siganus canaliculatus]
MEIEQLSFMLLNAPSFEAANLTPSATLIISAANVPSHGTKPEEPAVDVQMPLPAVLLPNLPDPTHHVPGWKNSQVLTEVQEPTTATGVTAAACECPHWRKVSSIPHRATSPQMCQ